MAPPPEYDKEPKAPDKSVTNIPTEESKALYNLVNEQQNNPETKTTNSSANAEVENNKHVEALDDGQLRALLDEAITYKCPKDREGKSNLFKELLESVEQDEQACKAAARGATRARRGGRARPALPHSNSLQDLVAALAAEPAPRRRAHATAPAPAPVSARAIHGGSLPSGVDTSFLLSEEPPVREPGGAEYVATVRCVNPSPLAERRVSASDAHDTDPLRRSKPAFPMTYTARATLEIGSGGGGGGGGGVGSGRAVTSTTASHQVRTPLPAGKPRGRHRPHATTGPSRPMRYYTDTEHERARREYRERVGQLMPPDTTHNPTNIRRMTIAPPASPDVRNLIGATAQDKYRKPRNKTNVTDKKPPAVCDNVYPTKTYRHSVDKNKSSSHNPKKPNSNNNIPPKTNTEEYKPKKVAESKSITETVNKNIAPEETELVEMASQKASSTEKEKSKEFCLFLANQQRLLQAIENNNKIRPDNETNPIDFKPHKNYNPSESIGATKEVEKETEKPPVAIELLQAIEKNNTNTGVDNEPKPIDVKPPINYNHSESIGTTKDGANETEKPPVVIEILQATENNDGTETGLDNEAQLIVVKPSINENRSGIIDTNKEVEKETEKPPVEIEILQAIENNNGTESGLDDNTKTIDVKPTINEKHTESIGATKDVEKESDKPPVKIEILQATDNNDGTESGLDDNTKTIHVKPTINQKHTESIGTTKDVEKESEKLPVDIEIPVDDVSTLDCSVDDDINNKGAKLVKIRGATAFKVSSEKSHPAEAPSNASILLTLYKRLLASPCNVDAAVVDLKSVVEARPRGAHDAASGRPPRKKKDKITCRLARKPHDTSNMKKDIIRNALTKLFLDNVTQSDCTISGNAGAASVEVDSAIPFSCITTPEVVGAAAPVPVDLKPLQLSSEYRSVASMTGAAVQRHRANHATQIPRNTLTGGFSAHGVPLPRPGATFGAVAAAAAEEFKKSLDENGNSLQGFSSPQSGASQQKKQRRKKTSKNEVVIKSHQIDGYQGNKDLNEVLRFIESAEPERGAKRHDDKKKRSAERRKDKAPRASSLDDLSRAVAAPPARPAHAARPAPAKPERRSWGDDARYFRDPEPDALELTDFQTVTKKRRPRRRADEPAARRPPAPPRSPPSPRARSDRSNDSTDDLDSVHSLPALPARAPAPPPPPPPPPLASYADIARTRHNIPDLIESCNYYAEGDEPREEPRPAAPGDADAYPALEARARRAGNAKPPPPGAPRRATKERASPVAPDVVADRRPPVVLREAACARDMDGVTFGFDVNEQLLRGRRCDLLRYLPPAPPPDTAHLLQIIDYVGSAWEDVVRCGGGKVRYFSE